MVIPEDKDMDGAPTIKVGDRELVREVACSYKSVKASQLITEVIEAIDLASILTKLGESQEVDEEVRRMMVRSRDLSEEIDELTAKLESKKLRKKDRDFVEQDIAKKGALREDILVDAAERAGNSKVREYKLVAEILPTIFEQAPEIIWRFDALMMVPNEEMMELSKKPNGIADKVSENVEWLQFKTEQFEILDIAKFYLPAVGFDMLKKAGSGLIETGMETLTQDLSKSSNQSSESEETT